MRWQVPVADAIAFAVVAVVGDHAVFDIEDRHHMTDAVDGIAKILQQLPLRAFLRFDLASEDKALTSGWSSSDIQAQRHRVALRL